MEVSALQSALGARDEELAEARREVESLRALLADRDVELERLRQRAASAAATSCTLASTVEGELVMLLERVHAARVEADAASKAPPLRSSHKSDAPLSLPAVAEGGRGGWEDGPAPLRARVEWLESAVDAGEEEAGEDDTRRANSSAPFDSLSQASLNTDDGRLTYSNSEYTQHLGALSDQEDDQHATAGADASPRSSVSATERSTERQVEPLSLPPPALGRSGPWGEAQR